MKTTIFLDGGWTLKKLPLTADLSQAQQAALLAVEGIENGWYPVNMPEQVHDVLIRHGVIENPIETKEPARCSWVAEQDWVYQTAFPFSGDAAKAVLFLEGVDTLADIYLNGERIAIHEDLYLPAEIDVTGKLLPHNQLLVHVHSPHHALAEKSLPAEWEGKIPKYKLLRKSIHDFFDYLGEHPYFTHMGLYGPVSLILTDVAGIDSLDLEQGLSADYGKGTITVSAELSGKPGRYRLVAELFSPQGDRVSRGDQEVLLRESRGTAGITLSVSDPALWWPAGHGEQPVYRVSVSLEDEGGSVTDIVTRPVGFRHIESRGLLDFCINGKEIKLYGSVIMPIQGISYCWDEARGQEIAEKVAYANMNILRIWHEGGVTYPDSLYDEFDRRGILIWQDFFTTYSYMPDSPEYRRLCIQEAETLVKRLKHHPCILLWCGGNETVLGAELAYSLEAASAGGSHTRQDFGKNYENLIGSCIFMEDYREVCNRLDPTRYYLESSPWGGSFSNDPRVGDAHGWDTEYYYPGTEISYFLTENCRAIIPPKRSLERIVGTENLWPAGYDGHYRNGDAAPIPVEWQRHSSGGMVNWIAREVGEFYDAVDADSLIYMINAAQTRYVRTSVESCRRGRYPWEAETERRLAGHLLLRVNDSFPTMFCGLVDYYMEVGMPYYTLRRLYEPVLLSFERKDHIWLWLINDSPEICTGTARFQLFDLEANQFCGQQETPVLLAPGCSKVLFDLDRFAFFKRSCILLATLRDAGGNLLARTTDLVEMEKFITFPEVHLTLSAEGNVLTVTSDRYARCIELLGTSEDGDAFGWFFEDNYFDLFPGEVKTVYIFGKHRKGTVTAKDHYTARAACTTVEFSE